LLLQSQQTNLCSIDRLDLILKHDLLRGMTECLFREPARMDFCPILSAGEVPAVTKQK
jgi:hypothetical protein